MCEFSLCRLPTFFAAYDLVASVYKVFDTDDFLSAYIAGGFGWFGGFAEYGQGHHAVSFDFLQFFDFALYLQELVRRVPVPHLAFEVSNLTVAGFDYFLFVGFIIW